MFFKKAVDWKKFLSIEDEQELNKLLNKVAKHRGAYKNADEVKIAQLWCALLELKKENLILQKKLKRAEEIFDLITQKLKAQEEEERKLIRSLEKF